MNRYYPPTPTAVDKNLWDRINFLLGEIERIQAEGESKLQGVRGEVSQLRIALSAAADATTQGSTFVGFGANQPIQNPITSAVSPIIYSGGILSFDQSVNLNNNARVAVRKNSGANVGIRRRLNFIEGSGITFTITDDSGSEEVDITVDSTATGTGEVAINLSVASGTTGSGDRNGHPYAAFDDTVSQELIYTGVLSSTYGGGGLTLTLYWVAASATSGSVGWTAAIERDDEAGIDIDSDSFAAAQTTTATAPGTSGQIDYAVITFTDGAQMDGLLAGEAFRLKITRDTGIGGNMTGDAQLLLIYVRET